MLHRAPRTPLRDSRRHFGVEPTRLRDPRAARAAAPVADFALLRARARRQPPRLPEMQPELRAPVGSALVSGSLASQARGIGAPPRRRSLLRPRSFGVLLSQRSQSAVDFNYSRASARLTRSFVESGMSAFGSGKSWKYRRSRVNAMSPFSTWMAFTRLTMARSPNPGTGWKGGTQPVGLPLIRSS